MPEIFENAQKSGIGYGKPPVETQFKPGNRANPGGKPVGARNRLQGDFLREMADDFAAHGRAAIVSMRTEKPSDYIRAIASLMPKELEITRPLDEVSDEDLNAAILAVRAVLLAQQPESVVSGTETA